MSVMNPLTPTRTNRTAPLGPPSPAHTSGPGAAVGLGLVIAPLSMLIGAAFWASTGVDLDAAAETRTVVEALPAVAANSTTLTVTFGAWLIGMFVYAATAAVLARRSDSHAATVAAGVIGLGAALAASAFVAFLTVVHVLAKAQLVDPVLANSLGLYASYADWIGTIAVAGIGPVLIALSGRGDWAPRWMTGLAVVVIAATVATVVSLISGTGLTTYGFAIVPTGMALTLSVGIVLWRRA